MKPSREKRSGEFESDPLWDLLGKAGTPARVSPYFARNVVREIRLAGHTAGTARTPLFASPGTLLRRWRTAMVLAATACIVILFYDGSAFNETRPPGETVAMAQNAGDLDVINNLDELLANEDSLVWLDSTASNY